jgi:prepilin-type N-terminal cleavage/methylation domain-containing protein
MIQKKGFTLIEVLLVVAIIGILAGIVIFAINPARQLAKTNNAKRRVDVNTILNGVYQYAIDNNGAFPSAIVTPPDEGIEICRTGDSYNCTGLINLWELTQYAKYIVAMPEDPVLTSSTVTNGTGYYIKKTADNRIRVTAPNAELNETISVTR